MRSTLRRRLFHMIASFSIVLAAWLLPKVPLLLSLGSVTFLFLTFEFIRLRFTGINWWFISHFRSMLREEEVSNVTTASYVLIAAVVAYLAFGKALEGDLACFVSCLAIGFILCYAGKDVSPLAILAGSVGATLGQAIKMPVDDNLTLPLLAGFLMATMTL